MGYRFIISGGGTGGHIFPAISIANALKTRFPDAEFLFVGALGRMEMERVPAAGYAIEGLPVSGFDRRHLLKNVRVLINLLRSLIRASRIIRRFRPDVAIGVGGYASAPVLRIASMFGVPTVLQEQNSYAGVANKWLAKKASVICVAYEGMEKFFPAHKIVKTGNPVRQDLMQTAHRAKEAYDYFGLQPNLPTLLIIGGSLGARTINQSVMQHQEMLREAGVQVIWQTGKAYYEMVTNARLDNPLVVVTEFIARMDYALAIADLVISRAGAGTLSELCLLGKPALLVPSPNVAEDHQTMNALALVKWDAAEMISDAAAKVSLVPEALSLLQKPERLNALSEAVRRLAEENSADRIADEVTKVIKRD